MRTVRNGKAYVDGKSLREWVPEIVAELVESFHPLRVILFGSVARGDDGPDSDIDMLVVLPEVHRARRVDLMAALQAAISAPVSVELFPTDPDEFARRRDVIGSFVYWPAREGEVVYERAA